MIVLVIVSSYIAVVDAIVREGYVIAHFRNMIY